MEISENYLTNRVTGEIGQATAIYFPTSQEDVVELMQAVRKNHQKLITIGGHTGLSGATFPDNNQVLMSLEKMNRIIKLDTETMTLTVEAGVTIAEISEFLAETPYFYAPDPGSKAASIGGNAATNAGGMRAVKYGVTRDNIRAMRVILADSRKLRVGSINRKDSSGYDLKDIFIGSEGTLGVITELDLKIQPKPKFSRDILLGFESLMQLSPKVFEILASGLVPATLEFFERDSMAYSERALQLNFPDLSGQAFLLITLDGNAEQQLENELDYLASLSDEALILKDEQTRHAVWQLRGAIVSSVELESIQEPLDVVVPVNQIAPTIIALKQMAIAANLSAIFFGHAGDGNIHANIIKNDLTDEEWTEKLEAYLDELYAYVAKVGGKPSAEHGIGLLKKPYFQKYIGTSELVAMKAIKRAFDPENILNPGKIFDL
ncbi:FAD-binding oxidoreductase [Lactococcus chungangensis]|mgnify:FL=1|jgi:FAD/FMN-containing dehydrogenases|uniref:Glycolate oxidase n=2 Tax=Pseudolactococcus chungangensis TaxID=451457 RepID=A0A1K2HGF0_9LACT|nr:FAD-binding oxidoreductase [Lactococcus chungangensis]MDD3015748.1 FAD-binding oxidoreductase [Lactococcus chungangensis]NLH35005.1 FAD-binding oxidoreductase [Lactococcus chungangensis]PCS02663.1 lactate dehydrogenase [Lactococcus chungangensis CAU 28 = DSM 22330]SFZ75822.1 glycolate oxidase [Lactococcus chungangensis CAU 28 = DSM 22330]